MGSFCRQERSFRFMESMTDTAVKHHGMSGDMISAQGLGFHEGMEVVLMYHTIKDSQGDEYLVWQETIFYDPEEDEEGQVARAVETLGLEEEEARELIQKINHPSKRLQEGEGHSDSGSDIRTER